MHHCFTISGLICTRKNMSRFLKTKMKTGGKKHDYKNLKNFSYQVDEVNKADVTEEEQELPPWIRVPKSRFNETKDVITRANESKLMTRLEKRNIILKNAETLL